MPVFFFLDADHFSVKGEQASLLYTFYSSLHFMKCSRLSLLVLLLVGIVVAIYFLTKSPNINAPQLATTIHSSVTDKTPQDFPRESSRMLEDKRQVPSLLSSATDAPDFVVDFTANKPAANDIAVPNGARVPAVLMDGGGPDDSPETKAIINAIIEEFAEKIKEAQKANRNAEEAWEEARETADERYRQFFGFEAFNAASLQAAGEAYEEATAQSPPTAP